MKPTFLKKVTALAALSVLLSGILAACDSGGSATPTPIAGGAIPSPVATQPGTPGAGSEAPSAVATGEAAVGAPTPVVTGEPSLTPATR